MNRKHTGALTVSFVAGFLAAWLVRSGSDSGASPARPESDSLVDTGSIKSKSALPADYERQIADLLRQLEAYRLATTAGANLPGFENREAEKLVIHRKMTQELKQLASESRKRKETENLLAAGFSAERIAWIRSRTEELAVEYRQKEDRLKQLGKTDVDESNAHLFDSDIDLRSEMGDDEYTRYRQALGRTSGLKVSSTLAGGIGEAAGIQPGDEILSYNGVRIYNIGQLNPLLRENAASGTLNTMEVLRNGQTIQLSAAGGDLNIRAADPWGNLESARAAAMDAIKLIGTIDLADQRARFGPR